MADADSGQNDKYNLQRFLDAQVSTYARARAELAAGEKRSHWMWFIFPQIQGLGSSSTAQRFAISGMGEAAAYLNHEVLGARLRECTGLVQGIDGRGPDQILGYPDDLKFHSCISLFAQVVDHGLVEFSEGNAIFSSALRKYFGGRLDQGTLKRLDT